VDLDLKIVSILREFDRVRFRHMYNKTLSDWSPLRPPNSTFRVERNYTTYRRTNPFTRLRIFRL